MARSERARVKRSALMHSATPFLVAAVIAALAVVALAGPRFHSDVDDPNDTRGLLDVRTVRLDHEGGTEFTVITFEGWTARTLWDRGNAFVFLDTEGGEAAEYFALVRSVGPELEASLWRARSDRADRFIRRIGVRRKNTESVSIAVPIKALKFGRARTAYLWWTSTTFTGAVCRRTCIDRVPDKGSVEQWRPGMSPTPTPSPSPSPSDRSSTSP
ncbi:MAG: hypothetical protein ACXWZF_04540 [Actinomycetota bacterium]